jgi:hypothetical protein
VEFFYELTPVELTLANVCNLRPCSPEDLAEMGKCVETTSVAANLFNPKPHYPEESVAQVVATITPQEDKATLNRVNRTKFISLDQGLFDEETESDEEEKS